jgi:hypothetical protein
MSDERRVTVKIYKRDDDELAKAARRLGCSKQTILDAAVNLWLVKDEEDKHWTQTGRGRGQPGAAKEGIASSPEAKK